MCSVSPSQHFVVVQSLSVSNSLWPPWTVACKSSLSFTNSQSLVNSYLSSWWWYPNISSSVSPFSPCPQSFPASGSFPMFKLSQLFLNVFLLFYVLKLGLKKLFNRYHLVDITVKSLINLLVPFLSLFIFMPLACWRNQLLVLKNCSHPEFYRLFLCGVFNTVLPVYVL